MKRLFTQDFLTGAGLLAVENGGSSLSGLKQLKDLLGIEIKQHSVYPELYHFSYDQIESPKGHPIVAECRGLILNSEDNWNVVAYPFNRFGNYGESWAAELDWTSVKVQEKIDGSLMFLWHYKNTWNVSTKGSPDAGGNVGDFGFTFAELFWKTLNRYYNIEPSVYLDVRFRFTYMFELTSIYNRVVCQYSGDADATLTLIGVRNNYNQEIPVSQINIGTPVVKEYPLSTFAEIEKAALALDPLHNEGFVVVDKNFNRVKVKSPSYVAIHHLKEGFGQRRIIRLIQLGEKFEILAYFPEYQELFNVIENKIDDLIITIENEYAQIRHLTVRKEFALIAQKSKNAGVLFALFLGQAKDVREYILHSKKVVKKTDCVEDFVFTAEKIENMIN